MTTTHPNPTPEPALNSSQSDQEAPNTPNPALGDTPPNLSPQNATGGRDHRHPKCPGCLTIWHQAGNRTGHCSGCHLTFDSLDAFDRHRRDSRCVYPGDLKDSTGRKLYERRDIDLWSGTLDAGTTYWRLALTDEQAARFERFAAERTEATS